MTGLGLSLTWVLVGSGVLTQAAAGARAPLQALVAHGSRATSVASAFTVPALITIAAAALVLTVAWQAWRPREVTRAQRSSA